MTNMRTIGRIGVLAAGLGIGAAIASSPGIAAADTSTDWWSSLDSLLSGAAIPAAPLDLDFQISFNGVDLFPTTDNAAEAYTTAGQYGLAIAYGDDAFATAEGGTGDFALASGTNANAEAGSFTFGATGNNYDTAVDIGNNGDNALSDNVGAFAGNGSLEEDVTDFGTDSHDSAYDIGNNNVNVIDSGAFAGFTSGTSGNGNTAYDAGNNTASGDGAFAGAGDNNYASDSGNNSAEDDYAAAEHGNSNTAIADTNDGYSYSGGGNDNYAYVYGPDSSTAEAYNGDSNVAYVLDPYGTSGPADSAFAGEGFSNNLAEVLLTHGSASADTANMLYDIVSLFGPLSGSF